MFIEEDQTAWLGTTSLVGTYACCRRINDDETTAAARFARRRASIQDVFEGAAFGLIEGTFVVDKFVAADGMTLNKPALKVAKPTYAQIYRSASRPTGEGANGHQESHGAVSHQSDTASDPRDRRRF
jgi:hypothetical protein